MAVEIPIAEFAGRSHMPDAKLLRRLDWRFLLPEPGLDSVGYVGTGKDSLLPALKWVAGSLAMIVGNAETPAPNPEGALCDVIVVQSSSFYALEQGITLLKPNGWLYWEVDRRHPDSGESTVNSNFGHTLKKPKELIKVLQRWGFCEVELNWHRPDFNACKEFVSLRDGAPLGFLVGQFAETGLPPWTSRVARSLILQGFLPSIFRCLSVVARKGLCEG
jgi:hypothetical protein